jgi:hypothetical protein
MISSKQAGELGFASRVLILNNPRLLSRRATVMIFPRLVEQRVPCLAAVIDDVVEGFKTRLESQFCRMEPPDIFLTIEF